MTSPVMSFSQSSPLPFTSMASVLGGEVDPAIPLQLPDPDPDDPSNRNCRLLGPFALFVQALMGVVVVGTLVLKRQRERPKRPWKIWMLDISKQMLGQLFVHTLNVALSSLGSLASEGEENPCSLYFLNIAIDTTAGVWVIYLSMRFLTHYFTDVLGWPGFVSGQYTSTPLVLGRRRRRRPGPRDALGAGNNTSMPRTSTESQLTYDGDADDGDEEEEEASSSPSSPALHSTAQPKHPKRSLSEGNQRTSASADGPTGTAAAATAATTTSPLTSSTPGVKNRRPRPRLTFFLRQLSMYLLSLLLMKILVVILFAIFPFLFDIGRWILDLFGESRRAQVVFVMALFPLAMNTLQFWLIDSLLRHNPHTTKYQSEEDAVATGLLHDDGQHEEIDGGHDDDLERRGSGSGPRPRGTVSGSGGGGGDFAYWASPAAAREGGRAEAGALASTASTSYVDGPAHHLVGDDSEEQGDEDPHAYPPPRSERGSSNEEQSRGKRSDGQIGVKKDNGQKIGSLNTQSGGAAASSSSEAIATTVPQDNREDKTSRGPAVEAEEEDIWDNWDDHDDGGPSTTTGGDGSGATIKAKPSDLKRD